MNYKKRGQPSKHLLIFLFSTCNRGWVHITPYHTRQDRSAWSLCVFLSFGKEFKFLCVGKINEDGRTRSGRCWTEIREGRIGFGIRRIRPVLYDHWIGFLRQECTNQISDWRKLRPVVLSWIHHLLEIYSFLYSQNIERKAASLHHFIMKTLKNECIFLEFIN